MNLGIDGGSLIREAQRRRGEGESLQESLRRVVAERYPGHEEEVLRATRILVDMMALLEGGRARRMHRAILDGDYRLTLILNVPEGVRRARLGTGEGYSPTMGAYSDERCPACGGDYLREFNFCLRCGSLWGRHRRGLLRRR